MAVRPDDNSLTETHEDITPEGNTDTSPGVVMPPGQTGEPGWLAAVRPFLGTWTLVPQESRYEDGNPPRTATQRIELIEGRVVFHVEAVLEDGWDVTYVLSRTPDGVDRPHPDPDVADIVSARVEGRTFETVSRRAGKVMRRTVRTLSPDGNRLIVQQDGYTQFGQRFRNHSVYQRA
ncbi:MAG TPA: hypothetical protein VIL35_00010 [Vicinamibacterales bacterium]